MTAVGGRPGPKPEMTAAARALRDSAIMAQLHSGEEVRAVASAHGLTARQVRKIAAGWEIKRTALEDRPMEIVERALREIEERMRNLALLAAETFGGSQPQVTLGALKELGVVHERHLELLSDVGKLPENLELFKSHSEVESLGRRMLELVRAATEGEIGVAELGEAIEAVMRALRGARAVDAESEDVRELPEVSDGPGDESAG